VVNADAVQAQTSIILGITESNKLRDEDLLTLQNRIIGVEQTIAILKRSMPKTNAPAPSGSVDSAAILPTSDIWIKQSELIDDCVSQHGFMNDRIEMISEKIHRFMQAYPPPPQIAQSPRLSDITETPLNRSSNLMDSNAPPTLYPMGSHVNLPLLPPPLSHIGTTPLTDTRTGTLGAPLATLSDADYVWMDKAIQNGTPLTAELFVPAPTNVHHLWTRTIDWTSGVSVMNMAYLEERMKLRSNQLTMQNATYDFGPRIAAKITIDDSCKFVPEQLNKINSTLAPVLAPFSLQRLLNNQEYIVYSPNMSAEDNAYILQVHTNRLHAIYLVIQRMVRSYEKDVAKSGDRFSNILQEYYEKESSNCSGIVAIKLLKDEMFGNNFSAWATSVRKYMQFKQDQSDGSVLEDADYINQSINLARHIESFDLSVPQLLRLICLDGVSKRHMTPYSQLLQQAAIPEYAAILTMLRNNSTARSKFINVQVQPSPRQTALITADAPHDAEQQAMVVDSRQQQPRRPADHRNGRDNPTHQGSRYEPTQQSPNKAPNINRMEVCRLHGALSYNTAPIRHPSMNLCSILRDAKARNVSTNIIMKEMEADYAAKNPPRQSRFSPAPPRNADAKVANQVPAVTGGSYV
jgi:hypothetical protein